MTRFKKEPSGSWLIVILLSLSVCTSIPALNNKLTDYLIVRTISTDNITINANSYISDKRIYFTVPNGYKVIGCVGYTCLHKAQFVPSQFITGLDFIDFSVQNRSNSTLTTKFQFQMLFAKC